MIKEYLNYMENDGTIPKREVVTPPDPEDEDVAEVQCSKYKALNSDYLEDLISCLSKLVIVGNFHP